jgi:hypothetical protein
MPPKTGGGGGAKKRNKSLDNQPRHPTTTPATTTTKTQRTGHVGNNSMATKASQRNFSIAPLILEGVKLNKLQLNDIIKQQLDDVRISDIQLGRSGIFTIYANDVQSFNRLLNELTSILSSKGEQAAKIYVPRSIQRIKDTDKVAFVKRVDLELPEDRITEALKAVGLDVTNVSRLTSKDGKTPTRTIKITFGDAHSRNTFVHTGLQVDCMHFLAEPASQNTKPVQCYICLKYNHIAKYCKIKQQVCARCGDNHRMDQCTVASDAVKCYNCKGNHLATSNDCSHYIEQEKRMLNLINQYSTSSKPVTHAPAIYNTNDFPPLPNVFQHHKDLIQNSLFDDILNALSIKMKTIIEETTNRLFKSMMQKIKKIEKSITNYNKNNEDDDALSISDSDSNEEGQVVKHIKNKQQQKAAAATAKVTTSSNVTTAKPAATTNTTTLKPSQKQKETTKATKRVRSPNSSLDTSTNDNKDSKTNNNDD